MTGSGSFAHYACFPLSSLHCNEILARTAPELGGKDTSGCHPSLKTALRKTTKQLEYFFF